ncbi:MAG TPA: hypothetical protein VG056_17205 [Pirellulales bacterium]|jgi:hypothetical protein|nr:hypothetical protein [Pirellulales bacterium]
MRLDELLVIALGTEQTRLFVKARVANSIRVGEGHSATYRVGRQFLARIEREFG